MINIEPGHDGRVIGNEPAVLIEFYFEGETAARLGCLRDTSTETSGFVPESNYGFLHAAIGQGVAGFVTSFASG